jgi:adenosyl cobinamide kinase/adenosyl cobinamide phosphate guanylyltransferase
MITLVTGGVKSGKTAFSLKLCGKTNPKTYIATAENFDENMNEKILAHRAERDETWTTIEEPLSLHDAIDQSKDDTVLIDCITMWLNNLIYKKLDTERHIDRFIKALDKSDKKIVIVTNEVGLGVMPANPEGCKYADELGKLNCKLSAAADKVILMVSGIPMTIKGE